MNHVREMTDISSAPIRTRPELGILSRVIEIACVLAFVVVTIVSLIPTASSSSEGHFDKVMHLVSYFVLTGLAIYTFRTPRLRIMFLSVSLYGALIEVAQGQIGTGRTASLADFLANLIGAALAIFLFGLWFRLNRKRSIASPIG